MSNKPLMTANKMVILLIIVDPFQPSVTAAILPSPLAV